MYIPSHNELEHYGVLGMKWGVRKEYEPKGRKTFSREKKAISDASKAMVRRKVVMVKKQVTPDKIGVLPKLESKWDSIQNTNPKLQEAKNTKLPSPASASDVLNLNEKIVAYSNNCGYCTIAYWMRQHGYDVEAKPNWGARHSTTVGDVHECFLNAKGENPEFFSTSGTWTILSAAPKDDRNRVYQKAIDTMTGFGPNASGSFNVQWDSGSGHAMTWENRNGQIWIVDPQVQKTVTLEEWRAKYEDRVISFNYFRTDDCYLDLEEVKEWVKPTDVEVIERSWEHREPSELRDIRDRFEKASKELDEERKAANEKAKKNQKRRAREKAVQNVKTTISNVGKAIKQTGKNIVDAGKNLADKFFKKDKAKKNQKGGGAR